MRINLEQTCVTCRRRFPLMSIEEQLFNYISESRGRGVNDAQIQRALVQNGWPQTELDEVFRDLAVNRCDQCRVNPAPSEISSALATLEQVRDNGGLANLLPNPAGLFEDIVQLMESAAAPIEVRRRRFSEWLRGVDLHAAQLEKKLRDGSAADQLLRQRLELIRRMQDVIRIQYEAAEAEIAGREKVLRAHLEQLKLEEEIARQQALREERLKTERLEETKKQTRLLNDINPSPEVARVKPVDPVKQAITAQRRRFKAKATAKQLVISDFLRDLQKVFRANVPDSEKAARLRAVLEAYRQEREALPKDVREFLDQVERAEGSGDE